MILNKLDKIFLEDPKRMRMGAGKLSKRYHCTPADIINSRSKVQAMIKTAGEALRFINSPKILIFDLEVSPNIVSSWRIGGDISLSHENIIQERAIICVGYKWLGEKKVHSLQWNKGDDKELVKQFAKIMNSADILLTQNGDAFDIKWMRTRAIYHKIPLLPKFNSIDTLKMARSNFKFNSNKLDYMGTFLGKGGKIKTSFDLWKDIQLKNCPKAMASMVEYCKRDIIQTEEVYKELQKYCPVKKFKSLKNLS